MPELLMPDLLTLSPALQAAAEVGWRLDAPFRFRFIIQPLIAILLGFRDGQLDAKAGTPPYLRELIFTPTDRKANLQGALKAIWKPLAMAIVLDSIVQISFLDALQPLQALLVGGLLVGLPYVLSRGLTNRLTTR